MIQVANVIITTTQMATTTAAAAGYFSASIPRPTTKRSSPMLRIQLVNGSGLAFAETAKLLAIVAEALHYAHQQGFVHRDVKPANILLENGVERVLLTDFGLARAADDASLTHNGIVAGTPHYMSPEQASGEPTDARSDLFSLGAVLYFMATGHPPFRAERAMAVLHRICHDQYRPVCEIAPHIPDELTDVIDRLLEKKPSRRFATAGDAQQAMAGVLSNLQQPRRWRTRRWVRRLRGHRWQLTAAAVVLVLAGAGWSSGWFRAAGISVDNSREATSPNATPSSGDIVALEVLSHPAAFANELVAIDRSLTSIAGRPDPESTVLRSASDSWTNDLKTADAAVTRLEKSWSVGLDDSSTLNSLKGENP